MDDQETKEIPTKDIPILHQKSGERAMTLVELDLKEGEASGLIKDVIAHLGDETERSMKTRETLARYYEFQASTLLESAAREMGSDLSTYERMRDVVVGVVDGEGYENGIKCYNDARRPQSVEFSDEAKVESFKEGLKTELNHGLGSIREARDLHLREICAENFMDMALQAGGIVPFASESRIQRIIRRGTVDTGSPTSQEEQPIRF